VLGFSTTSAQAAPVLDANCPGPPNGSDGVPADARFAQTFTVQTTGSLVQGEVEVNKPASSNGDWVMEIYATDGSGIPTNTLLASTTIPNATVPAGDSRLVGTFAVPASVQAGQQYAISLRRSEFWVIPYRSGNPCPGQHFVSGPTGPWNGPFEDTDLVFAVLVEPELQPKADRTLTLDANKGKVEKGRKVRLSGQIDAPQNEAGCEPSQTVELQRKKTKAPDTAFATFRTVQTDQAGNFAQKLRVKKTRVYRAVVQENEACDDELSNTQKVRVQKKKAAQEA
jgi:hypothetical protein